MWFQLVALAITEIIHELGMWARASSETHKNEVRDRYTEKKTAIKARRKSNLGTK
jgi:hypothetical protein